MLERCRESEMILALADIAGFAKACRGKSDAEMFALLDRFYRFAGNLAAEAGGTVVKYLGDCVFMVFPRKRAEHIVRILGELRTGAETMWADFDVACQVRVHAHFGRVVSGPIGPDQHFDVIGKSVNDLFSMPADGPELSDALQALVDE